MLTSSPRFLKIRLISDFTIQNKYNETVLDMEKGAQKVYFVKKEHKGPKSLALPKPGASKNTCIDFTTRNGWPDWEEIIRRFEERLSI